MSQELGTEQKTRQKQLLAFWSQINSWRARLTKNKELIITDVVAAAAENYRNGVSGNLIV